MNVPILISTNPGKADGYFSDGINREDVRVVKTEEFESVFIRSKSKEALKHLGGVPTNELNRLIAMVDVAMGFKNNSERMQLGTNVLLELPHHLQRKAAAATNIERQDNRKLKPLFALPPGTNMTLSIGKGVNTDSHVQDSIQRLSEPKKLFQRELNSWLRKIRFVLWLPKRSKDVTYGLFCPSASVALHTWAALRLASKGLADKFGFCRCCGDFIIKKRFDAVFCSNKCKSKVNMREMRARPNEI
jgi:hypothetical protein